VKGEDDLAQVEASVTSCHEAGHAVERFLVFGTTGAICSEPIHGKEAGAEVEPLPPELFEENPTTDGKRWIPGPYSPAQQSRLEQELKVAVAGSVAEAAVREMSPLDVLSEPAQTTDWETVWGIAHTIWQKKDLEDREVERLTNEVEQSLRTHWAWVRAVAEKFDAQGCLSASEVGRLLV
jgi:hypothetical protein